MVNDLLHELARLLPIRDAAGRPAVIAGTV